MTIGVIVLLGVMFARSSFGQDTSSPDPPLVLSDQGLFRKYVVSTLGPVGALHATLASGFEQWRGAPPTWGTGLIGYSKRWTSQFAESAIGNTTKYGVARAFHHDPSFVRCQCSGWAPRLRHATASPFMARTRDGRRVFSLATVAGITAENVIPASTWYPAPHGLRDGALHATAGVLAKIGVDIAREFMPHRRP